MKRGTYTEDYTYMDVEMELELRYEEYVPQSYDEPASGGYFEILSVKIGDQDVTELLDEVIDKIEEKYNEENL